MKARGRIESAWFNGSQEVICQWSMPSERKAIECLFDTHRLLSSNDGRQIGFVASDGVVRIRHSSIELAQIPLWSARILAVTETSVRAWLEPCDGQSGIYEIDAKSARLCVPLVQPCAVFRTHTGLIPSGWFDGERCLVLPDNTRLSLSADADVTSLHDGSILICETLGGLRWHYHLRDEQIVDFFQLPVTQGTQRLVRWGVDEMLVTVCRGASELRRISAQTRLLNDGTHLRREPFVIQHDGEIEFLWTSPREVSLATLTLEEPDTGRRRLRLNDEHCLLEGSVEQRFVLVARWNPRRRSHCHDR